MLSRDEEDSAAERNEQRLDKIERRMEADKIDATIHRSGIQSDIASLSTKVDNITSKMTVIQEITDDYREQRDMARAAAKLLGVIRAISVFTATVLAMIASYFTIIRPGGGR